jgi:hypothetical protein
VRHVELYRPTIFLMIKSEVKYQMNLFQVLNIITEKVGSRGKWDMTFIAEVTSSILSRTPTILTEVFQFPKADA